jgi:hypothetical protein
MFSTTNVILWTEKCQENTCRSIASYSVTFCHLKFLWRISVMNKIGKRRWRQQVASFINTAVRKCGLLSPLLERNNKCNNGIQGHCCENDIRRHCCKTTVTSVHIVASVCSNSGLGCRCLTICNNNDLCCHCYNSVFRQWARVMRVASS